MANILVTGGPVHAHLDSVKVVTNRFKGGRMVALAEALREKGHFITFIGSPHGKLPMEDKRVVWRCAVSRAMRTVVHRGFADYRNLVMNHATRNDMVILGAAVANLIPLPPWDVTQKFPSHDYDAGDEIMVPFRVAPRIINEVKRVNPRTTLIGFKLLQGVEHEELIRAAQLVSSESNAAFVIANDADDLSNKFIVTRERSAIPALDVTVGRPEQAYLESIGSPEILVDFLDQVARDEHYTTDMDGAANLDDLETMEAHKRALDRYSEVIHGFKHVIEEYGTAQDREDELLLGCVAIAVETGGFLTSPRGKVSPYEVPLFVKEVDHDKRTVISCGGKPSLNAPFLDWLFRNNPHVWGIVHYHQTDTTYPHIPYAPPGTVRDSQRMLDESVGKTVMGFEVEHHGVFKLLVEGRKW